MSRVRTITTATLPQAKAAVVATQAKLPHWLTNLLGSNHRANIAQQEDPNPQAFRSTNNTVAVARRATSIRFRMVMQHKLRHMVTPLKVRPTSMQILLHTKASANSSMFLASSHISLPTPAHRVVRTIQPLHLPLTDSTIHRIRHRHRHRVMTNTQGRARKDNTLLHLTTLLALSREDTTRTARLRQWLRTPTIKVRRRNSTLANHHLVVIRDSQVMVRLRTKAMASNSPSTAVTAVVDLLRLPDGEPKR